MLGLARETASIPQGSPLWTIYRLVDTVANVSRFTLNMQDSKAADTPAGSTLTFPDETPFKYPLSRSCTVQDPFHILDHREMPSDDIEPEPSEHLLPIHCEHNTESELRRRALVLWPHGHSHLDDDQNARDEDINDQRCECDYFFTTLYHPSCSNGGLLDGSDTIGYVRVAFLFGPTVICNALARHLTVGARFGSLPLLCRLSEQNKSKECSTGMPIELENIWI